MKLYPPGVPRDESMFYIEALHSADRQFGRFLELVRLGIAVVAHPDPTFACLVI